MTKFSRVGFLGRPRVHMPPQGEVQPGEQLLSSTLEVWKGPSMIITGDNDPTVPTQVRV